jgi:hypothetical protein
MPTGDVVVVVSDGGAGVTAPLSSVQAVLGISSAGTNYQIVASRNVATFASSLGYGPLTEAAALKAAAGILVLAVKVPLTTKGTASAVVFTGTGTSVITVTVDGTQGAFDNYFVKMKCTAGGTIGTSASIQVSLDAGRNYGPVIALGVATTYLIANTGVTINFAAGTLVTGDTATFGTTGPKWATADITTALNTLQNSQYGVVGWGAGTHVVGNSPASATLTGGCTGANASTVQTSLESLATNYVYTRGIIDARDASPPAAYGGTAETDATWYGSVATDYGTVSARRLLLGAGHYNMPSALPSNASAGTPSYRRPSAWAITVRQGTISPQRMASRVRDGALGNIVLDSTNDPLDGFVYHDDGSLGPLDTARIAALRTRKGSPGGFYLSHPNLLSPAGSDFNWFPKGLVMDIAASLAHSLANQFIDQDVRVNATGTIFETDARTLESTIGRGMDSILLTQGMVSSATSVVVSRTANVSSTSIVPVLVTIFGKGYIDEIDLTVQYNNPLVF